MTMTLQEGLLYVGVHEYQPVCKRNIIVIQRSYYLRFFFISRLWLIILKAQRDSAMEGMTTGRPNGVLTFLHGVNICVQQ